MSTRADAFVEYCMSIAKEFDSRLSRIRVFVRHNLSSGTANEVILRDFLSKHAPGNFDVAQGFLCDPSFKNVVSKQCDILIHDQNHYPLVYSDGPIKIVWPDAVRMVIEVKTNFDKKDIQTSIENIISVRQLKKYSTGVIFAFQSPKLETVIKHLESYPHHIQNEHLPTPILLLDKGIIIHCWGWARQSDLDAGKYDANKPFAVRISKRDKGAIVVTFLLLLFFQALEISTLHAEFINMLMKVVEEYTDEGHSDIRLGQLPV